MGWKIFSVVYFLYVIAFSIIDVWKHEWLWAGFQVFFVLVALYFLDRAFKWRRRY